jgi:lipopolysaccharide/colanic/teichoic acid biosynthesis glycosyltransferase
MDVVISALALIVAFPLMLVLGLLVYFTSPGGIFFAQRRLGKDGIPFTLYKFRSMYTGHRRVLNPDGSSFVLPSDSRITSVGRFLRKTSLDELPQLFNVLKGEMSIVGPRPDESEDIFRYIPRDRPKLNFKPGLTSLAVIKGRNSIPWKERIQWDVWYINHYTPWLDLEIMLKTVPVMLLQRGVYNAPPAATSDEAKMAQQEAVR